MRRTLLILLLIALLAGGVAAVATLADPPAASAALPAPIRDVALDPTILDPTPLVGGGVEGMTVTSAATQNWRVHAFAQIGNRIFVGGAFTTVTERPWAGSPTHAQPYLAAFDLYTNNWVSTFTPTFDDAVWTLAVHDGKLLVGGEFDNVNGVARQGLVELDPETGAIVDSFAAYIDNVGSSFEGSVRALEVVGDDLYVVGDFNRLVVPPTSNPIYRIARLDATTGAFDGSWRPQAAGGGVFDIMVDASRNKAVLVGTFTSMNATASTLSGAVVNLTNGNTVSAHPISTNGSFDSTYATDDLDGRYWLGGEQHYLQVRNANTWAFQGCAGTGTWVGSVCASNSGSSNPNGNGGDFQYVEAIDGYIVAGCHCAGYHWNTFTGERVDLEVKGGVRIYRPDGTDFAWGANLLNWSEGGYAAFADTNGCLYLGGDYTGAVDGFGRMCPVLAPESLSATTALGRNDLSWSAPGVVGSGIDHYEITRDGGLTRTSTTTTFVDTAVTQGQVYSYSVAAVSSSGTKGKASVIQVTAASISDPVVAAVAKQVDQVGTPISPLTIAASDPDGGSVTFAATGLPAGLAIAAATGVVSGTPSTVQTVNVTVTVTDDEGATVQTGFGWVIHAGAGGPADADGCPGGAIPFGDVSPSSFAVADIACIFGLGVTTGTSPVTYDPGGLVTREQMAAFVARLWRALGGDCPGGAIPFGDVSPSSFAVADIACIFGLGVTTGTSPVTYDPGGLVTREQMAAFVARLWRALGGDCPGGAIPFGDVSPSSFAVADIACIFGLGVTTGTSPVTYDPGGLVTREQMAAFVARLWRSAFGEGLPV